MGILVFWILIGGFIGGFLQIIYALSDNEELSYKIIFWYAMVFYENNKDKLNFSGLIIVIVAMSLLLLPGYILIFFIMCLYQVFYKLWEAYKYIFRKNRSATKKERIKNRDD